MKVRDLIIELLKHPMSAEVVMAKDSEGNDYSPLADVAFGRYDCENTWSGEFRSEATIGNPEYRQPSADAVPAVCLGPVN